MASLRRPEATNPSWTDPSKVVLFSSSGSRRTPLATSLWQAFRVAARISSLWGRWTHAQCWGLDYTKEKTSGYLLGNSILLVSCSRHFSHWVISTWNCLIYFLHIFFICPPIDTHTHTHTHTHTRVSFLRTGLLSCPLLSLYFEGCFCHCLLKGEKCLTYEISSKPTGEISDPGKPGLLFGSFIHRFIHFAKIC